MEKRKNCSSGAISPLFHIILSIYNSNFRSQITYLLNVVVQFIVFLTLSTLICRGTDISKCFRESLGIPNNVIRLYIVLFFYWGWGKVSLKTDTLSGEASLSKLFPPPPPPHPFPSENKSTLQEKILSPFHNSSPHPSSLHTGTNIFPFVVEISPFSEGLCAKKETGSHKSDNLK